MQIVPLLCDLLRIVGVYDFSVETGAEVIEGVSALLHQLENLLPSAYEALIQDFIGLAEMLMQIRIHTSNEPLQVENCHNGGLAQVYLSPTVCSRHT
jgi:hypothetical protein